MAMLQNLITDVPGLRVGHASDATIYSGVTVLMADAPMVAAVDVRGGGTGTRELDALGPMGTVEEAHAVVLSGGSAFGLSAASGAQAWLAEQGIGFAVRSARVPIVPQAILFDLLNGGDKAWGRMSPYEQLGYVATARARDGEFALGSQGAGFGATTANLRGGLGSASAMVQKKYVVGALVAVNAVGSATMAETGHFWAHPFERDNEFGGLGPPPVGTYDPAMPPLAIKGGPGESTTLAVVATNAKLTKPQAHRLAIMAQTGLAKALHPVHTPLDGDVVFAVSTGEVALTDPMLDLTYLGATASEVLARAIARGVYHSAQSPENWQGPLAYNGRFGNQVGLGSGE